MSLDASPKFKKPDLTNRSDETDLLGWINEASAQLDALYSDLDYECIPDLALYEKQMICLKCKVLLTLIYDVREAIQDRASKREAHLDAR